MAESTIVNETANAQAAATASRSSVKVAGLTKSQWFTGVMIVVLVLSAIAISGYFTWTFALRLAWAGGLWIAAGQLAKFKVESIGGWNNVPQTFKSASVALVFFAVLLSGVGQWTGWILNETDDCFTSFTTGDYTDCGGEPPIPGTQEVTASRFIQNANGGEYELRDDSWLTFHWPDSRYCVQTSGVDVGYIIRSRDNDDQWSILSRGGTDTIKAKILAPGETWSVPQGDGTIREYTC
tara:strand:+ start:972 stop:1685 length:714 start_codon:yes stop_codon:yes gene_type:complete